ncbi:LrgB family protein [Niallia sp.]|uniref:LrgB family protein n=1 Tax=Niallia sp. TaxID=2837523 RepID=UPI00289D2EC1|nr:LrgB family protein [Niallia sp.]
MLTIFIYVIAYSFSKRVSSPFTTPVLTTTIIMVAVLLSIDVNYEKYESAKEWISILLGPATVALAVPLYKNRAIIKGHLKALIIGVSLGTISTIISAVGLSKVLGLSNDIQATSAVKAVTTPVAIETVVLIGGNPSLTAVLVVITGIFGAVFGPVVLSYMNISEPFARGLGMGTVSHGIGTSQAVTEGSIQGAVSSVGMGIAAIITSIILPLFYNM